MCEPAAVEASQGCVLSERALCASSSSLCAYRESGEGLQGEKAGLCRRKLQVIAAECPVGHQAVLASFILLLDDARRVSSECFPSFLDTRCPKGQT